MKRSITILILIQFNLLFSQNELLESSFNQSYTWQSKTQYELDKYYFNLSDLHKTNYKYYFRIRVVGQIIDLYGNNDSQFNGKIYNQITELKTVKKDGYERELTNKYVYEVLEIDSFLAAELGGFLLEKRINQIPTDSLIDNWESKYMHCNSLQIWTKIESENTQALLRCYGVQKDTIAFSKEIKEIMENIDSKLNLKESYNQFTLKLEKGKTYKKDEEYWRIYIMTHKDEKKWENQRPKFEWEKENKDTIRIYLMRSLEVQTQRSDTLDCPESFTFVVNKKGRISKLKPLVPIYIWQRIGYTEYNICVRRLRNELRMINIGFMDMEYPIEFEIYVIEGKVSIY